MTGVGHIQVDHLHPPSTDSLTGQGHVTVCINSRTISRLKPIYSSQMENWLCSGESQHKKLLEDL